LAVQALRDAAELAALLGRSDLEQAWIQLAECLKQAINAALWNDEKNAYTDCSREGLQSKVYSQQTQTAAYISGVAEGERAQRCRQIIFNPPDDFVKAGSPFFEFFLLEAYQDEQRVLEFLETIRKDWGFMIDQGATTFWEMWSVQGEDGRLTRSHCHGWSAAPTYFLSTYVLGVNPEKAGFAIAKIAPHPGDLAWCRGSVPTPQGCIEVEWENIPDAPFVMRVHAPTGIQLNVSLPREGQLFINDKEYDETLTHSIQ
jgi:hypothetical protein